MTGTIDKDVNCSLATARWFQFVLTEEIYTILKNEAISETERFDRVSEIATRSMIHDNPRLDLFLEFYYQVVRLVN